MPNRSPEPQPYERAANSMVHISAGFFGFLLFALCAGAVMSWFK